MGGGLLKTVLSSTFMRPLPTKATTRRPHDLGKAYSLVANREIARRLLADPDLVAALKREAAQMTAPSLGFAKALWAELSAKPVQVIAAELSRDDERGDRARETRPPFIALDVATLDRLRRDARTLMERP